MLKKVDIWCQEIPEHLASGNTWTSKLQTLIACVQWNLCNSFKKHVVGDDGLFTNCLVAVELPTQTCTVFSS